MKIFQVLHGICHWDATSSHPTIEDTIGKYTPDTLFVEAPDYVFVGWGYLDSEFIKPTPPPGWLYDDATGTFYQENTDPPSTLSLTDELAALVVDQEYRITLLETRPPNDNTDEGIGALGVSTPIQLEHTQIVINDTALFHAIKRAISSNQMQGLLVKVDVLYENNKLTSSHYNELMSMINTIASRSED